MRRLSFRFKVIAINIIAIALVTITGIFAYDRFSRIVGEINEGSRPDLSLLQVKSLINDIGEAESYVKSYGLTKDTTYLNKYYFKALECDVKWGQLKLTEEQNPEMIRLTDSLGGLIEEKFSILNDFLMLQDQFRVQEALDKVVYKIESSVVPNVTQEQPQDAGTKKGFLSRLFKRKKNEEEKRIADSIRVQSEKVSILKVSSEVNVIKEEERAIEDSLKKRELALLFSDKSITDLIRGIVARMETVEKEEMRSKSEKAQHSVEQTNFQIALCCIAIGIFLLIMTFTIIKYIRYNNRYRRALQKAKAEAEDLALTKDKFFTNISHEIRTPMNAISGFADLIAQGPLTPAQVEQITMLQKSTDHLLYLINDVLDLAKLDAGKLHLEATGFNPAIVIAEAKDLLTTIANENDTELAVGDADLQKEETILIGDPYRLKQILLNIVGNAIKFTKKGCVIIKAEVQRTDETSGLLKLNITDTGIGMSSKQLEKVFQEFEQADISISRNYGGSGLGLSIVYKLIKLHNGNIEIRSQQGIGTTVLIDLPYKYGSPADVITKQEKMGPSFGLPHKLKVLIVDDEVYNRKLLTTILSKYHADCIEAENGQEALKEVKKNHFDIILMDSRMPKMNGVEAVKKIRDLDIDGRKHIPVIALTAAVSETDQQSYVKAGMQAFIPKPFKEIDLIETINLVLEDPEQIIKKTENGNGLHQAADNIHIDLTELKNLSQDDSAFYRDMLETYLQTTSEGISLIQENLKFKDWSRVADHAHKIAAPSRHIGANKLYQLVKEIENKCRNEEELDSVSDIFSQVKTEYSQIEEEIKNELLQ